MKFLAMLLLLPTVAAAQVTTPDTTARPISLDEAVRLAQRNSPLAVQARGQIRNSAANVRGAWASFLPSASINMGADYDPNAQPSIINNQLVPGAKWTGSQSLSLNLTVFDGGQRFFDVSQARANLDAAEANEVAQSFNVALNVKQAFFNALAARESEAAALAQLEQAEQQLRASAARVQAGVATRSDSLRSAIQVGNAQLALLTARTNLESANATLTRLVATPFMVTANPADTLDQRVTLPDSAQLIDMAEHGPAVQQARSQLTAARAADRSWFTSYLPTITATFRRSANGPDLGYGLDTSYSYRSSLGFTLSFPIFDRLNRERQNTVDDVARANAEAALRDTRLAAQQTLVTATGALRTAQQRVEIQQASVAAAEEDLRVQTQRYAVGASTLLDVLTSQTQLNQARAALIQARYDFRVAKAQIEALIGRNL